MCYDCWKIRAQIVFPMMLDVGGIHQDYTIYWINKSYCKYQCTYHILLILLGNLSVKTLPINCCMLWYIDIKEIINRWKIWIIQNCRIS